ncbi:bifunctional protein FolD 4, chloroplastic-like isoform X2 [Asparagus officinalis]|uniref:bifunctional protein FolD 4, chloroplastic-like isoform X2 n=1 Tax=Asparagus officinalis TaxID=4686 RepID=UPI00098E16DB|nr:bifunctional protein FolD 4, chloroplastic-like isoform X2 [Asparagus officinalis]
MLRARTKFWEISSSKTLIKPYHTHPRGAPLPRSLLKLAAMASALLSDCAASSCSTRLHPFKGKGGNFSRPFHCPGSVSFPLKTLTCQARGFGSKSTDWSLSAGSQVTMTANTLSTAKVIDGKSVAKQIREEVASEVAKLKDTLGITPGLAVILVGSRKDSQTYVRNKKKACEAVGIKSYEVNLPEDCTEEDVLKHISGFNDDPSVHGILVQLPLPRHMDEQSIINAVSIEKDVDGFNPLNIGCLALQGREPLFVPCTPKGCMELLRRYGIEIKGKRAVVIGRSNIVGMPAALLLQRENATVTVVHSRTNNPEEIIRQADIVISACGVAHFVRGSWLKPGVAVIDVGINPVEINGCR